MGQAGTQSKRALLEHNVTSERHLTAIIRDTTTWKEMPGLLGSSCLKPSGHVKLSFISAHNYSALLVGHNYLDGLCSDIFGESLFVLVTHPNEFLTWDLRSRRIWAGFSFFKSCSDT